MRSFGSVILVLLSFLLAAVGGPALWAERNVVNETGFVELAAPLAANADFQQSLSTLVGGQAAAQLDLPAGLQNLAAAAITAAAGSLQAQPGYDAAWAETLRRSHALTFDADTAAAADIRLDVAPLVALVGEKLSADLGISLPAPDQVPVELAQPTVAQALPALVALAGLGGWLLAGAGVLLLGALLLAKHRSGTLIFAGLGLGLVALAWLLGAQGVEALAATVASGDAMTEQFGRELGALAHDSWQWGIRCGFIVAGALLAVGVVSRIVRGRATA